MEPLGFGGDVAHEVAGQLRIEPLAAPEEHLAAAVDRGDGRPQLVRQHPDERVAQPVRLDPGADVGEDRDRRQLTPRFERADREVDRERRPVTASSLADALALLAGPRPVDQELVEGHPGDPAAS